MKVVSPNYRDRKSEFKWLIRDQNDHPDKAVAFKNVTAVGVTFGPSNAHELGYGCAIVAYCTTAIGTNHMEDDPNRITFTGFNFVDSKGQQISTAPYLRLDENGKMFAMLHGNVATRAPEPKVKRKWFSWAR